MEDPEAACDRLAATQHGVLSRGQALAAGLSARAIERRVASGRWRVALPAVYIPRPVPGTWHQRLMTAALSGGTSALVSHAAAARLWELDGFPEAAVEISIKAGRRIRGVIVHRRRPDDDPDVASIAGLPVIGVGRTLLDLASRVSRRRLGLALDDALRRGVITLPELCELLASLGSRGRPGSRGLSELIEQRDDRDARMESPLEASLLALLREHGLLLPTPQFVVMDGGEPIARLDFAYPELLLGIEADGFRWHGRERWEDDLGRENRLKLLGWTLLRFSSRAVRERPEMVVAQIRAVLAARSLNHLPPR